MLKACKPFGGALLFLVAILSAATAYADDWPGRPIRFLIPYGAGAMGDITARLVADKIRAQTGQTIIVENKGGAAGTVGTEEGIKAAPDGHTWILGGDPALTIAPHMMKVPYDASRDLVPVSLLAATPMALFVNASLPVHSFAELVDYARAHPGKLTVASAGNGTPPHLMAALFKESNIDVLHVPYRTQPQVVTDLLAGRVDMTFSSIPSAEAWLKAGKVRMLAVSSPQRAKTMPDVPTFRELGYPQFEMQIWVGVFLPAGTPRDIVSRVESEFAKALADQDIRQRFAALAYDDTPTDARSLQQLMQRNDTKFAGVIKRAGIKPD